MSSEEKPTMAKWHTLKVEHEYMEALKSGEKNFEVRRDDRGFQKGDALVLCRYGKCPTGYGGHGYMDASGKVVSSYPTTGGVDRIVRWISYVLTGGQFGIQPGYVVLGLDDCEDEPN